MDLKKRPQKPEMRKRLRYMEIELFPKPNKVPVVDDDGYIYDDNFDYEEVPSPSLADIVRFFEDKNIDISDVYPKHFAKYDYIVQDIKPVFYYDEWEPKEEYDKRVEEYKEALKEYNKWYKIHKEEIKAEKDRIRLQKEDEKKEKSLNYKKEKLLNRKKKIEKELEALE